MAPNWGLRNLFSGECSQAVVRIRPRMILLLIPAMSYLGVILAEYSACSQQLLNCNSTKCNNFHCEFSPRNLLRSSEMGGHTAHIVQNLESKVGESCSS